jgi:hypothetical protein
MKESAVEPHMVTRNGIEQERVFSSAKITLSDRRCRMGDDVLDAVDS